MNDCESKGGGEREYLVKTYRGQVYPNEWIPRDNYQSKAYVNEYDDTVGLINAPLNVYGKHDVPPDPNLRDNAYEIRSVNVLRAT